MSVLAPLRPWRVVGAWSDLRRRVMVRSAGKPTGVLGRLRDERDRRRCPAGLVTSGDLVPQPHEFVLRNGTPDTIAGWKALTDGLLTNQSCVFHRNLEISSRYAWLYKFLPSCFKWAGMAAFASHHVRLALFPLRLDRDRTGYVDIPHSLGRRKLLLMTDVNTIRETNNAIFDDIFWVHLAYATAEDGIGCLRSLLRAEPHYAPVLAGFEAIDGGRRVLEDPTASAELRRAGEDLVWQGNVQLLEHEQRALVQPNLDALSCAFARLFSIGSALSFEVRGLRDEVSYFTSFYYYALTRGVQQVLQAQAWPRITRFDDRWRWIVTCIVPRFRRLDLHTRLVDASLRRVFDEARDYASNPCVLPGARE
jgi:PAS domain-containing protein